MLRKPREGSYIDPPCWHAHACLLRLTAGMLYKAGEHLEASNMLSPAAWRRVSQLQSAWLQPKMILLDVGMATELTNEDQTNMLGLFR
jgi:hypothetical protein